MLIGVNIQDKEEPARRFLAQFRHTFPNAPDPSGRVSVDYGVYGVPETFFIDREGLIVHKEAVALNPPTLKALLDRIRS